MTTVARKEKVECLNPNTGGSMNIDRSTYELFAKAIYHTLKKEGAITYSKIVEGVKGCFREQQTAFKGSVSWYAVTVKNDMEARGVIESFTEKGKKLNRLVKNKKG